MILMSSPVFGSPIGKLKRFEKSVAQLTESELKGLSSGPAKLEFESGVVVEGLLKGSVARDGQNLILVFDKCTVTFQAQVLFKPDWGTFDMVCGDTVVSVFGGAADRSSYIEQTTGWVSVKPTQSSNLTDQNRPLNFLYEKTAAARTELARKKKVNLDEVVASLDAEYPDDWLLRYELLELNCKYALKAEWEDSIRSRLSQISNQSKDKADLIHRGLELL